MWSLRKSGLSSCVFAGRWQGARKCSRFGARHLPAQAGQPDGAWNGLMRGTVVADHAATDSQCVSCRGQQQVIAMHPAPKYLVADLPGLLLRPGIRHRRYLYPTPRQSIRCCTRLPRCGHRRTPSGHGSEQADAILRSTSCTSTSSVSPVLQVVRRQ
jgi:hypothetical protein